MASGSWYMYHGFVCLFVVASGSWYMYHGFVCLFVVASGSSYMYHGFECLGCGYCTHVMSIEKMSVQPTGLPQEFANNIS